ncbi:MAG: hypothetical protein LBR17_05825 [Bacteroidales bacterium]|jgi:hypothetical protein|nr:hypothetical protein [Bacteroidales bacterium]
MCDRENCSKEGRMLLKVFTWFLIFILGFIVLGFIAGFIAAFTDGFGFN